MGALSQWVSEALPCLLQEVTAAASSERFWSYLQLEVLLSREELDRRHDGAGNAKRELNE